jgi:uncharacterized LabA/DUF88 family protein
MATILPILFGRQQIMMFIDGENLAIRYGHLLQDRQPPQHVLYERNVFVWSKHANLTTNRVVYPVKRKYYYTSARGDDILLADLEQRLRSVGIEAPRVFKKNKDRGSKQVDISLAVDMLTHAHRGNYDIAILVAGDEDYVPLVQAVMNEGKTVAVWFVRGGLSPALEKQADHFFDIGEFLLNDEEYIRDTYFKL